MSIALDMTTRLADRARLQLSLVVAAAIACAVVSAKIRFSAERFSRNRPRVAAPCLSKDEGPERKRLGLPRLERSDRRKIVFFRLRPHPSIRIRAFLSWTDPR